VLAALDLQTWFLSPPMAICADYLEGLATPQVRLIDIFRGALLFLFMVFLSMIMVYNLNRLVERLQRYLYSG
jgi:TRAP-type mannitol/chloroaromatic compound transport system permease large subunit